MLESLKRKQGRKVFDPMPKIPESIRKGTELHAKMIKLADEATGIPAMFCKCGKPVPRELEPYKCCPDCCNEVSDRIENKLDHSRYQKRQNQDQEAAEYEKQR